MIDTNILPECFADTAFVQILGYKNCRHQDSKGEVARIMRTHYKNRLAIGLVDQDKPSKGIDPKYFAGFKTIKQGSNVVMKHLPDSQHYLIELAPAFEKWIFHAADLCDVDPAKYGFRTAKNFAAVTKSGNIGSNQNFQQFINALKQKNYSPVKDVLHWLRELDR